jgi:DNA helicase-4
MTQSLSVFQKILMAHIARLDLSKYFPDEIKAKYGDAMSIASARLSSLHVRAIYGGINIDSLSDIMESSMTIWDADKNFPLHLAAASGRLFEFPVAKVAIDQLHYINADGCSVFDLAHYYENVEQLPPNLRSDRFRQKRIPTPKSEPVIEAARVGKLEKKICERIMAGLRGEMPISTPAMLPDIFYNAIRNDRESSTLLHLAAENDSFDDIPIELLTEESLLLRDRRGRTPLHRISSIEGLGGLPPEIVTRKVLTARDHQGISVADVLVDQDTENIVPDNIRLLAKEPVIARIKELIAQSPNAAEDFWSRHGREHLSEQNLHDLVRDQRLQGIIGAIQSGHPIDFKHLETGDLLCKPPGYPENPTLAHLIARSGLLHSLPDGVFSASILSCHDDSGRTPFHYAVEAGTLGLMPAGLLTKQALLVSDKSGITSFHIASGRDCFGSVPVSLFDRDVLLSRGSDGRTVADIIEECGNTPLLPFELRFCSRIAAVRQLERLLATDYHQSEQFWREHLTPVVGEEEFRVIRREFVREWSARFPDMELDEEQAEAVSEFGLHTQVTARAGSGKTRTLVARALFQITHCRISASNILILAFNRKAVEEIRERLSKYLSEEQMPHVLTFHALAYRIVRPSEDLIFDEGETKESQVFSTTTQRIIDEGMRGGTLEEALRELMEARWSGDLGRIIALGFNLPQEEFLAHRANLLRTTMNGRRVDTEAHKRIGNALLRLGIRYSYRRGIHRAAGTAYAPDFFHYHKETEQRFLIEVLGEDASQANAARQAFWNSDRSANAHLLQFTAEDCQDPDATLERVARELANREITVTPMSDDELWLALRDDVIRDFTKAVKGFISRCQKELISPDRLDGMLPESDPELWGWRQIGYNRYIKEPTVDGMQVRFWRLCSRIYRRYRLVLAESHQTDFDQLMLDAAGMIREGNTGFSSDRGRGDIRQIRHLLIDEYQDFSHLFDELRKSIVAQSSDANFFCVGDDWQAINKFAGADLRYFAGFTETFEPSVRKLITSNYRSCRKIVEIGNQVMHGQGEPSVPNSNEQGNTWRVEVGDYGNLSEAEEIVVDELGDDALAILRIASDCTSRGESVAILSRTSSVATPEGMHKLERWQERLRSFLPEKARGLLEVSTTHGYKGKEADVVILLDPEAYPFIHPDAIFNTIFGDTFQSIEDDEKRLFYVGVTRPKNTLYLLSYPSRYSETRPYRIRFLANAYPPSFDINRLQSNLLCGSRVVVRLTSRPGTYGNGGTFPIKDRLKELEFKWNEDRKIWTIFLERGSISSPFECVQYLNAQPWISDADGIVASFAWEDQKHQFRIERGVVVPDGAPSPVQDRPQPIGGQWKPNSGRAGQTSASARPHISVVVNTASHPSDGVLQHPVTMATKLNQSERSVKSPGTAVGVFETSVAGMRYEGRMEKASHLSVGDFVRLEREPSNTHDRNAIQVMTSEGVRVGYVSRHVAAHLAAGLDAWGGISQAKVSSVWKQPPPHFLVSIQICFPLPPGVVIPEELDASSHLNDSPFAETRSPLKSVITAPLNPIEYVEPEQQWSEGSEDTSERSQDGSIPEPPSLDESSHSHSGSLTPAQENALGDLLDPSLASLITELYLSGCCSWPEIGYEARNSRGLCTGSMLEVAWPDSKIGIALASNDVGSFAASGWTYLPAATVSVLALRSLFSAASGQNSPTRMTQIVQLRPPTPIDIPADEPVITEMDHRYQHGPFMDDELDDDLPF